MKIPDVQIELDRIIEQIKDLSHRARVIASTLDRLNRELPRRPPLRKSEPQSKPMTPEMAAEARRLYKNRWSQMRIAEYLGVNPGRISEAVRGKRT